MQQKNRAAIVAALASGPATVCELSRRLAINETAIREHVARLCEIGVATGLVVEARIVYRLRSRGLTDRDVERAEAKCEALLRGRSEVAV